jgi:hypothetical protein
MKLLLLLLPFLCVSCVTRPVIYTRADGTQIASLGGSLLSREKNVAVAMTLKDGSSMSYSSADADATGVASNYFLYRKAADVVNGLTQRSVTVSNNAVKTAQSADAVKIAASDNAVKIASSKDAVKAASSANAVTTSAITAGATEIPK